jgi:hypothetical protein
MRTTMIFLAIMPLSAMFFNLDPFRSARETWRSPARAFSYWVFLGRPEPQLELPVQGRRDPGWYGYA